MNVDVQDLPGNKADDAPKRFTAMRAIWPRLIELWLAAVLVTFFVLRVLGSQTGQRLLGRFTHSH